MRLLLIMLTGCLCVRAQSSSVQLYKKLGTSLIAIGTSLDLGTVPAGDSFDVHLSMRNIGPQAVPITTISASTEGDIKVFSTENQQPTDTLAAGGNVDFVVRFSPRDPGAYRGTLYYHSSAQPVTLTGMSPEGVTVQVQNGGGWQTLQTDPDFTNPVDFGAIERKQSARRQFALLNSTAQQVTVNSIFLTGAGYAIEGLTLPVTLNSLTSKTFAVRFTPLKSGVLRGMLSVDGRVFSLEGFAREPAFPVISFEVPAGVRSGQQVAVKIKLSEASRAVGPVTLTLAGLEQDSSVALLPSGGRTATVALQEGATELTQMLQTGTTQGTLRLSAELGVNASTQKIEAQIVLAPLVPVFSTVTASRVSGRIELKVTGFDNTRGMRDASFQFYDASGAAIGGAIPASLTEAFGKYFAGTTPGGTFAMGASFPVQGDITQVKAVDVQLTNSQGTASASRTTF